MNSKTLVVVTVVVVILVAVVFAQPQRSVSESRYQLVAAQVETTLGGTVEPGVFLLDAQAGRVWIYQSNVVVKNPEGKEAFTPEFFRQVEVKVTPAR